MVSHTGTALRTHRLRPLNLPRSVVVEVDGDEMPVSVTVDGRRREVEEVGECWRIDDEWWRNRIARRYVEVMLVGGGHVVVYEDSVNGGWFLQQ